MVRRSDAACRRGSDQEIRPAPGQNTTPNYRRNITPASLARCSRAMPSEARADMIKGLEMIIGMDVCPAMVGLLGKGSVDGAVRSLAAGAAAGAVCRRGHRD